MIYLCAILLATVHIVYATVYYHVDVISRTNPNHAYNGTLEIAATNARMVIESKYDDHAYVYRNNHVEYFVDTKSNCTFSQTLQLPFDLVLASINATNIVEQDVPVFDEQVADCRRNNLTIGHITLGENEYVTCTSSQGVIPSRVLSEDFIMNISLSLPNSDIDQKFNQFSSTCKQVDTQIEVIEDLDADTNQHTQPWFADPSKTCQFDWMRNEHCNDNGLDQQVKLKDCVFIHGSGIEGRGVVHEDHFTRYWGHVQKYTPQCSRRFFIDVDTRSVGWNDAKLQRSVCDAMLHQQNTTDNLVRDRIVFAHSMGNLVIAAAIKNGICDLDNTTSWYSIQAPYLGSVASMYLEKVCRAKHFFTRIIHRIAALFGYCQEDDNLPCAAYTTMNPDFRDNTSFKELQTIAKSRVTGSVCGTSAWGLNTHYAPGLSILSALVGFKEKNDGMVDLTSCTVSDHHSKHYKDLHYATKINHADATCRNGNGWISRGKPCNYYSNKY